MSFISPFSSLFSGTKPENYTGKNYAVEMRETDKGLRIN